MTTAVHDGMELERRIGAVARAMASLGKQFAQPEVIAESGISPKAAPDHVVEIILAGLAAPRPERTHAHI